MLTPYCVLYRIEIEFDPLWDPEFEDEPLSSSEENETIEFDDDGDSDEDYYPRFSVR